MLQIREPASRLVTRESDWCRDVTSLSELKDTEHSPEQDNLLQDPSFDKVGENVTHIKTNNVK